MQNDPIIGLKALFVIFLIGMFVRLVSTKRIGLLVLFVFAGVFLTYGLRQSRMEAPPAVRDASLQMAAAPVRVIAVMEAPVPPPAEKPARPKRAPKPKAATKAVPAAPAATPTNDTPPEPPVAAVAETSEAEAPAESVDEAPLTLYQGWSSIGRPIDSLPEWVKELENAPPGSDRISFSSDRFATLEEAENQLWDKARDFVGRDLQNRFTKYARWTPPADFLKSHGFILERCVERTTLEVGKYVEPMYRVHWKAALSQNVRDALVDAYRPTIQEQRLHSVALSFLEAAALLALVNVILRLAPCPNAKKTPPTAA